MTQIVDDLLDFFTETISAVPGHVTSLDGWVNSGEILVLPCRIEGVVVTTSDPDTGREVVSRVQVIIGGYNNLTTDRHRYVLPTRYPTLIPSGLLRAVSVDKIVDDEGPCYERVLLP